MNALASATRLASEVAVRATILFALTGFALLALRRAGAAARHRAATLGLAAGLVLPLLSLALPHVPVRILSSVSSSAPAAPGRTAPLLLALWALGTLAVAARLAVGWSRVKRLSREAAVVWDAEWIAERDDAARRLAVQRTVPLKESDEVPVAITSGWRRPLLLVGRAARLWAVERRRIVLLHELAHVKRADWPALLVAEAAVALYWFHPLAIWLGRRVRREAEQACDELVIASGTKPSVYAGHLLGIFRSVGAPHPVAPALAIARPHAFEARLRAILDPTAPGRRGPGPRQPPRPGRTPRGQRRRRRHRARGDLPARIRDREPSRSHSGDALRRGAEDPVHAQVQDRRPGRSGAVERDDTPRRPARSSARSTADETAPDADPRTRSRPATRTSCRRSRRRARASPRSGASTPARRRRPRRDSSSRPTRTRTSATAATGTTAG